VYQVYRESYRIVRESYPIVRVSYRIVYHVKNNVAGTVFTECYIIEMNKVSLGPFVMENTQQSVVNIYCIYQGA
jgi:hypothetical protein